MPLLIVMWVGRQCIIVVILTHLLHVCGDSELTKVASGMRRDFFTPLSQVIKKPAQGLNGIQM